MHTPLDESTRQRRLDSFHIVDSLPESAYDDIVKLASGICDAPMALITLVDRDRQWFKAKTGIALEQTPREIAFCDHAIREPRQVMEVRDATVDTRFQANPLVTGDPNVRFYAGAPLLADDGTPIGTVCVLDDEPRELTAAQRAGLASLARLTMTLLETRRREIDRERSAVLAGAVGAEIHPASETETQTPPPRRTVVIFELQDHAGAVKRMGERAVEREMAALTATLEAKIHPAAGDSINRVTGSNELIAVVHGDDVFTMLQALHDQAGAFEAATSLRVLSAFAEAASADERIDDIFLRAADALGSLKDRGRAAA